MTKYFSILLFSLVFIAFACKKTEEPTINPCFNGKLDNGEEEIDCGGPCNACYKHPYLVVSYFNNPQQLAYKEIIKDGDDYLLKGKVDSVDFQINIGQSLAVSSFNIIANKTYCTTPSAYYTLGKGFFGISDIDTQNKLISGNFEIRYAKGIDTLLLENGQFENLAY